jgi:trimethylamine:corrinoid methyltransferase-like protein
MKPQYEMQVDRMVVNLENSVVTAGASALETLEKSPGVAIDRQHNTIALMGKNGAKLMINGKLSRMPKSAVMQMLASMDAENISKIELDFFSLLLFLF